MPETMGPIERAIRQTIAARKETKYVTAKESGVNYATLFKFLEGGADIRLSTVEILAKYLGLELTPKGNERKTPKR